MDENRNIIRVGIVSAIDPAHLRARVYFPHLDNLVSDWLAVIQQPIELSTEDAGSHSHTGSTSQGDSLTTSKTGAHKHKLNIYGWMPKINEKVLILYIQGFSADGFILGVIP